MFAHQIKQRGSGLLPFAGQRYQKGNGFWGDLMKKAVMPFLRYAGKRSLSAASEFAKEAIANPEDFKGIAKRKALEMAGQVIEDGGKRAKKFIQTGKGIPEVIKATPMKPIITTKKRPKVCKKDPQPAKKKPRRQSKFIFDLINSQ